MHLKYTLVLMHLKNLKLKLNGRSTSVGKIPDIRWPRVGGGKFLHKLNWKYLKNSSKSLELFFENNLCFTGV